MNNRERYINTLTFRSVDKIPLSPGYPRESTLAIWHTQGLPEGVDYDEYMADILGIGPYPKKAHIQLDVDFKLRPWFEEKVLEKKDGHLIVQDWMGSIVEISDQYDFTYLREPKDFVTRRWLRFPVESRQDWYEMKKRYDAFDEERLPANFESVCRNAQNREEPLALKINGPFWQLREWVGFENLCMMFADDPDLVEEMAAFWCDFVSDVLDRILSVITPDTVCLAEDMAYKAHSMISPEMTRTYIMPSYKRWASRIRAAGCPIIDVDSDGYVADLIPIWIESGVNVCNPMEVAAHNDIVAYRGIYGKNMAYTGGIDKRAIAAGGDAMRDEVMRVVPPLLKDGGFIPSCDHGVPPDISWTAYLDYARLLASLTGWI